jgi:hypothetical protein
MKNPGKFWMEINTHRLKLTGESMRKAAARNTGLDPSAQA